MCRDQVRYSGGAKTIRYTKPTEVAGHTNSTKGETHTPSPQSTWESHLAKVNTLSCQKLTTHQQGRDKATRATRGKNPRATVLLSGESSALRPGPSRACPLALFIRVPKVPTRITRQDTLKKTNPKAAKVKDKERVLKAAREKQRVT